MDGLIGVGNGPHFNWASAEHDLWKHDEAAGPWGNSVTQSSPFLMKFLPPIANYNTHFR